MLRPEAKPTRTGGQAYPTLLLGVALMVGGIFVAGSRGGIAVALVEMALVMLILGRAMKGWQPRLGLAAALLTALGLGWTLAGTFLRARFTNSLVDESLSGRTQIFDIARKIAVDFPVWGSGAETFLTLNGLYRGSDRSRWHGYVHDDWLETQITLGWVGLACVVAFLVMVIVSRIRAGSVPIRNEFSLLLVVGLAGLLGHARVDFPFQIPSIHLLFLMVAAAFTVVGPVRIFGKR